MTFNGLTDKQAERSRRKYGSNRVGDYKKQTIFTKLSERFGRIPVKIYIIIMLLYTASALICGIFGADFMPEGCVSAALLLFPAAAVPVIINCAAEMYIENRSNKRRKKSSDTLCKVYRCGNTVSEIPTGDIVKGDFVLLTEGDIVPAEGMVVHGDITSESKRKGSRLIRNFNKEDLKEDISGEITVERGEVISSGYAVIKITNVGTEDDPEAEMPSRGYTFSMICAGTLSALLIISYMICALSENASGIDGRMLIPAAAYSLSLILLASEGLPRPADFFRRSVRSAMFQDGIRAYSVNKNEDLILADKSSFITDGRPFVSGFTDGSGQTYRKFYEVPYPLGTIAARAAASNTSALMNRGNVICSDAYECAEINFISERIKNTLELEISPELINGDFKGSGYKKLIKGPADKIIKNCSAYFDGAGKRKNLSNTAALAAMAEELSFRGSRVVAYAAEDGAGSRIFIGMVTLHEKLRSNAADAYKEFAESGVRVIMLDRGGSAESVSIADKAVTGATADEIIAYDDLEEMSDSEAVRLMPKLKIITGECDKEYLIELAKAAKMTVGATALNYSDIEKTSGADAVYAPTSACGAVCRGADAVLGGGLESLVKYFGYSRAIKNAALWYDALRIIMLAVSALMMSPPAVSALGVSAYFAAIVIDLLLSAASCVLFSKAAAAGSK